MVLIVTTVFYRAKHLSELAVSVTVFTRTITAELSMEHALN
jgi:hypothetical protein